MGARRQGGKEARRPIFIARLACERNPKMHILYTEGGVDLTMRLEEQAGLSCFRNWGVVCEVTVGFVGGCADF